MRTRPVLFLVALAVLAGVVVSLVAPGEPKSVPSSQCYGPDCPAATTTALRSTTGSPSVVGERVTYTATVTTAGSGTPTTGNVEFFDGGAAVSVCRGTAGTPVDGHGQATCTETYDAVGSHVVTAHYLGTTDFAASASTPVTQRVVSARTTVLASASPTVTRVGDKVTYTARVSAVPPGSGTPSGTVSFTFGSIALCHASLSGGKASCVSPAAPVGVDHIDAAFSGDIDYSASSSRPTVTVVLPPQGYWLATETGSVFGVGGAPNRGGTSVSSANRIVGITATLDGEGYWVVSADGSVFAFGDAKNLGSLSSLGLHVGDIVAIVATADGGGYWLLGADGQVYAFGDATFHGDLLHIPGNRQVHVTNIVGMVAAPSGSGYILIGSDGGVFAFGAVHYYGSLPGLGVKVDDIRGILPAPTYTGYVLVGADGGAFVFGHGAPYKGSLPGEGIKVSDIIGIALTPGGQGYWMAGSNGVVYPFGNATRFGEPSGLSGALPVDAISAT
jgi:hypothetical protein